MEKYHVIYLKIFGLAVDDKGNPDYAIVKINNLPISTDKPYEEAIKVIDIEKLLNDILQIGKIASAEDAEIITKEEYEKLENG